MSVATAASASAAPPVVGDAFAGGGGVTLPLDLRRCCAGGGVGDGLLLRFSATLRPLLCQVSHGGGVGQVGQVGVIRKHTTHF